MGAGNSSYKDNERILIEFLENYRKVKDEDERYGNVSIYQHIRQLNKFAIMRETWNYSDANYGDLMHEIKIKRNIEHPNLCTILSTTQIEDDQWCSTFEKNYLMMEFFPNTLENKIKSCKRNPEENVKFIHY